MQEHQVARVSVGQNEIRYQLRGEDDQVAAILRTTPIFDLELPKLLESEGLSSQLPPRLRMAGLPVY